MILVKLVQVVCYRTIGKNEIVKELISGTGYFASFLFRNRELKGLTGLMSQQAGTKLVLKYETVSHYFMIYLHDICFCLGGSLAINKKIKRTIIELVAQFMHVCFTGFRWTQWTDGNSFLHSDGQTNSLTHNPFH